MGVRKGGGGKCTCLTSQTLKQSHTPEKDLQLPSTWTMTMDAQDTSRKSCFINYCAYSQKQLYILGYYFINNSGFKHLPNFPSHAKTCTVIPIHLQGHKIWVSKKAKQQTFLWVDRTARNMLITQLQWIQTFSVCKGQNLSLLQRQDYANRDHTQKYSNKNKMLIKFRITNAVIDFTIHKWVHDT